MLLLGYQMVSRAPVINPHQYGNTPLVPEGRVTIRPRIVKLFAFKNSYIRFPNAFLLERSGGPVFLVSVRSSWG
jgi:hypothetical protein